MAESWRPIATAPTDGTALLLVSAEGIEKGAWSEAAQAWVTTCCLWSLTEPTHWLPLPLPPEDTDAYAV